MTPPRYANRPKLKVLDLFSGIGGFSLGLERTGGFETVAFCEIEDFPRRVLAKYWPEVPCYEDVTKLTADILERDGIGWIDVITGGFPCQDISVAGRQAGIGEGTRSGLWSEIVRLTRELRPRYIIVENVAALLSGPREQRGGWFGRVLGDLAECGYDAEWENIPASALGAPHRRERVWIVAYPKQERPDAGASSCNSQSPTRDQEWNRAERAFKSRFGRNGYDVANAKKDGRAERGARNQGRNLTSTASERMGSEPIRDSADGNSQSLADTAEIRQPRSGQSVLALCAATQADWQAAGAVSGGVRAFWSSEPDVGRVANGVPSRVDRLGGLGNAVVPQIPEMIGHAILEAEQ